MNETASASKDRLMVDLSLLIARVIVGLIFFVHGAQKLLGWYGGKGLAVTVSNEPPFGMGPIGYPVSIGECLGGLGIMVGFLSRFSAASNIVIMIGAIVLHHGKNGLLMQYGGFEYNLALIGLLAPIMLCGPGQFSIGRFLPLPKQTGSDRPMIVLE